MKDEQVRATPSEIFKGIRRYTQNGSGMVPTFQTINGERFPVGDWVKASDLDAALEKIADARSERGEPRWIPVAEEIARARIQEVTATLPVYTLHRGQWYRLDGLKEPK